LAMAFRRISSLTGTDSQPDSRSSPNVLGRDMAVTLPVDVVLHRRADGSADEIPAQRVLGYRTGR
jgi:hypothetical protein